MRYFEVKIKIDRVLEDGTEKKVSETYAVDAVSFTEAEARITAEMQPYITGNFAVTHEKIAQYTEVIFNGGELFFLVKYNLITVEADTMKEHRVPLYVLFQEESIDAAKEHAREYMKGAVVDYEIEAIRETKILDVIRAAPPE